MPRLFNDFARFWRQGRGLKAVFDPRKTALRNSQARESLDNLARPLPNATTVFITLAFASPCVPSRGSCSSWFKVNLVGLGGIELGDARGFVTGSRPAVRSENVQVGIAQTLHPARSERPEIQRRLPAR